MYIEQIWWSLTIAHSDDKNIVKNIGKVVEYSLQVELEEREIDR